ncbi:DUF1707 and DUF4190 domain-containing protein [Kitasatospora sp. NPDC087861]|uniref:DUF1707 and DUF4190 domain-containing protein n=1 Tax=Kitasatospora sp. NPDC087861 TaxID=3364070 RepID=UPI0038180C03
MAVQPWGASGPGDPDRRPDGGRTPAPAPQAGFPAGMRAGHADRDRTIDVLKAAFAEGRLSTEEYEQRHEQAAAAQTYGQLAGLVADLPIGPMPAPMAFAAPPVPATFLPPPPPPARSINVLAVTSLVFGLTGFSLPAVVVGHVAKAQPSRRDRDGDWMATLGLVFGYAGCAFWTLVLLVLLRVPA